jgi:hypothetical protein
MALALGLFLVTRRATGEIASPLSLGLLIATAVVLVAWAWLLRLKTTRPIASIVVGLPLLTVLLFAFALSYPGTRLVDWLVWLIALAAVLLGPHRIIPARRSSPANARKLRGQQLLQELKRYRTAEGREFLRGTLLAEFLAGQRNATLYAAFCPPFEFLPQIAANVTGNASASVKVAQVLHNGVQLEVRLSRIAEARQVVTVELLAAEAESA